MIGKLTMYTRHQLGKELKELLSDPYDPIQVSKKAYNILCKGCLEIPQELSAIIPILKRIASTPTFEYSQEELLTLADKLIHNEENPFQQIHSQELKTVHACIRQRFIKEFKELLSKPYDPIQVADWAYRIKSDYDVDIPEELNDIIDTLAIMSMGVEFEYSQEELLIVVDKLINNEKDPFQQMRNIKFPRACTYTKQQLIQELQELLLDPYDPIQIVNWAYQVNSKHRLGMDVELSNMVEALASISIGSKSEYSQEELLIVVKKLINNEKDPFQQLLNQKFPKLYTCLLKRKNRKS